jgi:hypothetical protein
LTFIRVKRAKRKNGKICEYAYISENRRYRKKKVKQKTKKYLGRVYRLDRSNVMDFFEFYNIDDINYYINNRTKEQLLLDLIRLELYNYGFEDKGKEWQKEDIIFNLKDKKVYNKKNKSVALAFNDGFLNDFTIKRILDFKTESEEDGYILAKLFIEAGIAVPKEIFIGFYRKIFK